MLHQPLSVLLGLLLQLYLFAPGCDGASGVCAAASPNWLATQLSDVGVCLYTQVAGVRSKYGYEDSKSQCNVATVTPGVTRLPILNTELKKMYILNALFQTAIGYQTLWTNATCNGGSFFWGDGYSVDFTGSCDSSTWLYFTASLTPDYSFVSSYLTTRNSSLPLIPVCEYDIPQCDPTTVSGFDPASMMLSVNPAFANSSVRFNCRPGFYRPSEIVISGTSGTIDWTATASNNLFYCLFQPSSGGLGPGTVSFIQIGTMNTLEACQPSSCQGWQLINSTIIPDVEDYKGAVDARRNYRFGERIGLVCKKGYVSVDDETMTNAAIECGQSDLNPSLGMWIPSTLVVCMPIKCGDPMPFYDSEQMLAYKAYDRAKDKSYSSDETNRFPYYPNEVSLKCRNDGYFFMDRTYDKALKCDLPGNGTNNTAVWFPFGGTVLSSDVLKCQPITCLIKEIVIITQQNDLLNYLSRSNFNDSLIITYGDSVKAMSIKDFTTEAALPFNSKVRFSCLTNYQMSAPSETGASQLTNSTEVTCASTGTWSFKVASCIKQTEALTITSASGKYVPPAQEAAGAESLGLIVIIILVVFFCTILILDLTTIARDLKLLRTNLRRIKLKMRMKKQT